jgi:hypothetical protein
VEIEKQSGTHMESEPGLNSQILLHFGPLQYRRSL